MLVFASSDKGGTGRSVTSINIAYRWVLHGGDACYLDFDFGSPTAGAIFDINKIARGTTNGGLHSFLRGTVGDPQRHDVWADTDRSSLRDRPPGAGRLVFLPGDAGGGEFSASPAVVDRCIKLFLRLEEEFDFCLVDLSAGRSYATELVLAATARPEMRYIRSRWLIFHRWTRQHIHAASGLVYGERGIIEAGTDRGHDQHALVDSIRFVRTAVVDPNSPELAGLRPAQIAWLRDCSQELKELASRNKVGRSTTLGVVPFDPLLQWREQLITDNDVWARQIANPETVDAFDLLAKRINDEAAWESL